jgi:hypothetical protein
MHMLEVISPPDTKESIKNSNKPNLVGKLHYYVDALRKKFASKKQESEKISDKNEEIQIDNELPQSIRVPKAYFHTALREGFQPELGVITQGRHETITDFLTWSLFFPYEKIGNYWSMTPRKAISFETPEGVPNFVMMVMDETSPVLRVTDRYKRAYVARGELPIKDDEDDSLPTIGRSKHDEPDKKSVSPDHFLAEVPVSRELEQKVTELKIALASFQIDQTEMEVGLTDFFEKLPLEKRPKILRENYSLTDLSRQLTHSIMRDYALRFIPAFTRFIENSDAFTPKQKARLWYQLEKSFTSENIQRYLRNSKALLESSRKLVARDDLQPLSSEEIKKLFLILNSDPISGERYLPSPGDKDFFGHFFSSGELTFWAKRHNQKELLTDPLFFQKAHSLSTSDTLEQIITQVDAQDIRNGNKESRLLTEIDTNGWSTEQMLDKPSQDVDSFIERNKQEEEKSEMKHIQRLKHLRNTPAYGGTISERQGRLIHGASEIKKYRTAYEDGDINDNLLAHEAFVFLTGTLPAGILGIDLQTLNEIGVPTDGEDSYGNRIAELVAKGSAASHRISPSDHFWKMRDLLRDPNSLYLTAGVSTKR